MDYNNLPKIEIPPDLFGPSDKIRQAIQSAGEALKAHVEGALSVHTEHLEKLFKSIGESFKGYVEPFNEIKSIIAETFDHKKFEELRGSFYELAQREKKEGADLENEYPEGFLLWNEYDKLSSPQRAQEAYAALIKAVENEATTRGASRPGDEHLHGIILMIESGMEEAPYYEYRRKAVRILQHLWLNIRTVRRLERSKINLVYQVEKDVPFDQEFEKHIHENIELAENMDLLDLLCKQETIYKVKELIENPDILTNPEREVIKMRFLSYDEKPTLEEVGNKLNRSRQTINENQKRALKKLELNLRRFKN